MDATLLLTVILAVPAYLFLLFVFWVFALVHVAINDHMGKLGKVLWVLGTIFIMPLSVLYFAFAVKNIFLRILGWLMLIPAIALIVFLFINPDLRATFMESVMKKIMPSIEVTKPAEGTDAAQTPAADQNTEMAVMPGVTMPQTQETPVPAAEPAKKFKWAVSQEETLMLVDAGMKSLNASIEGDAQKKAALANESVAEYGKILATNPGNAEALLGRGMLKETMKDGDGTADFQVAESLVTRAIAQYPDYADLYALKSKIQLQMEKYSEAEESLSKAMTMDPGNVIYQDDMKVLKIESGAEISPQN